VTLYTKPRIISAALTIIDHLRLFSSPSLFVEATLIDPPLKLFVPLGVAQILTVIIWPRIWKYLGCCLGVRHRIT